MLLNQTLADIGRPLAVSAVEQLYLSMAYLGGRLPASDPKRHGVKVLRNIPYDQDSSAPHHRLDVYRPIEPDGLLPVVMYIHGGGFRMLSKDTHWVFGLGFARSGYIVFNVNYRLSPKNAFPAGAIDVCRAYRWIAENAERFGGDSSRIILAGESAGANLASVVAIASCCDRPEPWARDLVNLPPPLAVMPCCGLLQVSDPRRFARRRKLTRFITMQLEQVAADYLEASDRAEMADPLLVLEEGVDMHRPLPPFYATVGTRDPILDDTRRLAAALERLSVPCQTRYYPGQGHAFHALVWRPSARQWWQHSLHFMAQAAGD